LGTIALASFVVGIFLFSREFAKKNGWQKVRGIQSLTIVNRQPTGFELLWTVNSSIKEEQWIEVAEKNGNYTISSLPEKETLIHHAVVKGLKENTQYHFRIRAGSKTLILPTLTPSEIHTPKAIQEKPVSPAYGKVIYPSTKPYINGIIVYEVEGFYPVAVSTKNTGEWLLPLTGLVDKKTNSIRGVDSSLPVQIRLFSNLTGSIKTTVGATRPLKQVIIAGTSIYLAKGKQQESESAVLGVTSQTTTRIIYPKENSIIPGASPLIRGTAPVGVDVKVLIQSDKKQYSYRTKTDDKGDWVVQSPIALEAGRYTITIAIQNGIGASTLVKRTFTIAKSGEQVLGEATTSASISPTSIVPTYANPTSSPVLSPTTIISQTLVPTEIIPTRFIPTAAPPVSGGGISPYLFGALFCIVVGAGLVLAF